MSRRLGMRLLIVFTVSFVLLVFQNFSHPDFPTRNIDTRTIQKINGQFQAASQHITLGDLSMDGRIRLSRASGNKNPNGPSLYLVRPEHVQGGLKDPRNGPMGEGVLPAQVYSGIDYRDYINEENLGSATDGWQLSSNTIMCERTEETQSPFYARINRETATR